ncbi:hypothetical protein ACFXPI_35620 [Streptomyces sp. NPDC059104]|uniref:hypothetical protein n=1 Tax=Streptomyces sp. NPDC059104 TaxID=3346729 RepID=UPI0036B66DA1
MAEAVRVRCPGCGRENGYAAPSFPCACGNPVTPPLDPSAEPRPLTHRTWSQSWVVVRCGACGREGEWPQPELGCGACGTVVRVPVRPPGAAAGGGTDAAGPATAGARGRTGAPGADPRAEAEAGPGAGPGTGSACGTGAVARPAFRPVTIRTGTDAVVTAALYLRWLGFQDVRRPDGVAIPSAAADLRAPGVVAQVDPTTAPVGLRAVECVWLNGLTAAATGVYFSLAGYTEEARSRADELAVPLFVMDLTGVPQPVNDPADELVAQGA